MCFARCIQRPGAGEASGKLHSQLQSKAYVPQLNCEAILVQKLILAVSVLGKDHVLSV